MANCRYNLINHHITMVIINLRFGNNGKKSYSIILTRKLYRGVRWEEGGGGGKLNDHHLRFVSTINVHNEVHVNKINYTK